MGRKRRVIVNMGPRHGKSDLISKWAAVWYLDTFPNREIINAGYSNAFAREWGVKVRGTITTNADKLRFSLSPDSRAADRWNTTKGGGMRTAGTEGQMTGKGANLLVIDDPIKDAADADSPSERDRIWEWWVGTASTRLNDAEAGVILCMTRWHHDDLAGRLIRSGQQGGEHWDVLNLPAIAGLDDPLGRQPGEALWPKITNTRTGKSVVKFPIEALLAIKNRDPEVFAAQYQGIPANLIGAGNVYKQFAPANLSRTLAFDPRYPLIWALDFNVNPMSAVLGQIVPVQTPMSFLLTGNLREFRVLQELVLPQSDTMSMCRAFQERTSKYLDQLPPGGRKLVVHVYGDRSGQSSKTSGLTDYEVIKDYFTGAHDYLLVMKLSRKNPRVKDRTNAVNMLLCNGAGQRRMVIHESCQELKKDFEQLKWRCDSAGNSLGDIDKKADSQRSHISDALGYAVEKEFSLTGGGDIMQSGIAQ